MQSVKLRLAVNHLAPADQLLWSVWGFCVLGPGSDVELILDEGSTPLVRALAAMGESPGVSVLPGGDFARDPHQRFAVVASAGAVTQALMGSARTVCVVPVGALAAVASEWFRDARWMAGFRARVHTVASAVLSGAESAGMDQALARIKPWRPAVSLVSSVFKADRFLDHFLANCAGLAGYRDMEHWLVRPGSPGNEHASLLAHARRWPGAVYLNLETDPGLYETWNLGCCLARGRYLSSANLDDRRHPQQIRRLASTLDSQPPADLASAALRVTAVDNQEWNDWSDDRVFYAEGVDGDYGGAELVREVGGELRPRNIPHCMPLWRRALHPLRGFFNEPEYGPSADWEYWLRCADGGSRYHHTPEALGLYLKREDSYWRRDPTARRFDERILARYAHVLKGNGPQASRLHALPWNDLTRFLEAGNWFGVLLSLVRLNAVAEDAGENAAGARKVAAAHARRHFGLAEFAPVDGRWLHGGVHDVLARLQPVLLDWLHAFVECADSGGVDRARAAYCWRALLVDWHLLTDDVAPLIGLALLQRRLDEDPETERELLRAIHARDPQGFWRGLQRVYRFAVPLEELVAAVEALEVPPLATPPAEPVRLMYFPSYSNKYQELLYWSCQRAGMKVESAADLIALEELAPRPDCANIVHLHWLNAVFADPSVPFDQAAARFLETVRGLKARGFAVYWTVHNRLNHDSAHPQAEARLRAELAALVDRVYLHHPLLAHELDWLPKGIRPWLCEHGPYVNSYTGGIDRALARQRLGLDAQERVLLWFGQVRPYKGLEDWLPLILEQLAAHGGSRLVVAGRIASAGVKNLLARFPDQTLFINRFVPNFELQHLACAADFGMLTYREILTSGAMFHMYGMGLPVIAPDKGSLPGYVVPGWNGFLYHDTRELGQAIDRVYAMTEAELARFRQAAGRTGRNFHWGRITE